jgi:hypothetical protein
MKVRYVVMVLCWVGAGAYLAVVMSKPESQNGLGQLPAVVKLPTITKPQVPAKQMNGSAVLRMAKEKTASGPFTMITPAGMNDYAVKLVDVKDGKEAMLIFVKGGSKFETKAPLGSYRLLGAYGPSWYGEQELFGDSGSFFKFAEANGNDVLDFVKTSNSVSGHVVSFVGVANGNARSQSISRDNF